MRLNRRQFDQLARTIREARAIGEPSSQTNAIISHIERGIADTFKDVDANFNTAVFLSKCQQGAQT